MPLKTLAFTVLCLFCSLAFSVREARADTYVILPSGQAAFILNATTQLSFTCPQDLAPCSTTANSVTFGTGADTTTFTFTGTTLDTLITNVAVPLSLGTVQTTITGAGYVRPPSPGNGFRSPLGFLDIRLTQTSPTVMVSGTAPLIWGGLDPYTMTFGTGFGRGGTYFSTFTGPNPPGFNYSMIVFSFPNTFPLHPGGTTNLVAQVGAVPEPATILLLGTGLAGALGVARRRRNARRGAAE